MTAAHFSALRLLEHSARPGLPPVEVARLTNAATRQLDVCQAACLTLQKLKTRGTQLFCSGPSVPPSDVEDERSA